MSQIGSWKITPELSRLHNMAHNRLICWDGMSRLSSNACYSSDFDGDGFKICG